MTSIQKVAKRAGVSPTTVSHAINHADRVSPEVRRRVEEAIRELGYRPNPTARSLRTGRTNLVALLIPDIRNPFYPELVQAIQAALGSSGLDTLIYNTDVPSGHAGDHALHYLRHIRSKRVDGVIIADAALSGLHQELVDFELPAVFIGHLENQAIDNVRLDSYGAAYRMGSYLVGKGHRRIAHITGPSHFPFARERKAAFEQALLDNGVEPDVALTFEGTFLSPSGREGIRVLMERHLAHPPTAVFVANLLMTTGALAALYDLGIAVPRDLALATFDDAAVMEDLRPRLTSVGRSPRHLGEAAVKLLLERLTGGYAGEPRTEVIPFELFERESA